MIWKDDGNTLANCSTHCTRDMSQTSRDTSYSIASFIFKVVSKNKG